MALSIFSTVRSVHADPVSGAIFTTDVTGTEVNVNQYAAKTDVYLNGGPGVNAPPGAAGLSPDGVYIFQVTDPSGKTLLSTDAAQCREVSVVNGVFAGPTGPCPHAAGGTTAFNGTTVQLFPFNDTPNHGGVYKAWVTPIGDYPSTCLTTVDCTASGTKHGFTPSDSKTDNFKVKQSIVVEIDTEFFDSAGNPIDGLMVTWADTLGASNNKWSEWNPAVLAYHQAHVEDVETGTHLITIANQAGCTVTEVDTAFPGQPGAQVLNGPGTVSVPIPNNAYNNKGDQSYYINVYCA
jgi:hypothetical protein